ncbi:unknown [Bifidobacterium bifidum CAG:234]|nr:unknown [Bifidobacterium bifidum CAG:234]
MLSMSTVTFAASFSFCWKNPSSWEALVATVQNGTRCPSMLMVV